MERKNIIIAISTPLKESKVFVTQAINWVKEFNRDANIVAVYAFDDSLIDFFGAGEYCDVRSIKEVIKEKMIEDGKKYLEEIKDACKKEGLNIETKIKVGNPVNAILKEVKEIGASAVLIAAEKTNILSRIIAGSTFDGLVKAASCPVIALAPTQEKAAGKIRAEAAERAKKFDAYLSQVE